MGRLTSVGLVSEIGKASEYQSSFLSDHFARIDAFANILTLDLLDLLNRSDDRTLALDTYIDELAYRRDDAVSQVVDIRFQESVLVSEIASLQERIASHQATIGSGYEGRDEFSILESLSQIEILRTQESDARSQLLFLQRFRADYESLIANTDPYLATLRANRAALVSGISVQLTSDNARILE